MPSVAPSALRLTAQQRSDFDQNGFLALSNLVSPADIGDVRAILDPMFDEFDQLPRGVARDLAGGGAAKGRILEINRAVRINAALRRTTVYRNALAVARELAGKLAFYTFDHAIYKPPMNGEPTHWHQDQAYASDSVMLRTVHFWIPLQEATTENGCMEFVPGSHHAGLLRHRLVNEKSLDSPLTVGVDDARAVACPLPVGGATLHTPLTLHRTGANRTTATRRAWILHFGPFGVVAKLHPRLILERLRSRPH